MYPELHWLLLFSDDSICSLVTHGRMGSLKSICLHGFQEYTRGVTSYIHLFKDQVSLVISWYLCALPAWKANLGAIFIFTGGSDNFSFYLF